MLFLRAGVKAPTAPVVSDLQQVGVLLRVAEVPLSVVQVQGLVPELLRAALALGDIVAPDSYGVLEAEDHVRGFPSLQGHSQAVAFCGKAFNCTNPTGCGIS